MFEIVRAITACRNEVETGRLGRIERLLNFVRDSGNYPPLRTVESRVNEPETVIEGRPYLMFGANNYLSLSEDEGVKAAAARRQSAMGACERRTQGALVAALRGGALGDVPYLERVFAPRIVLSEITGEHAGEAEDRREEVVEVVGDTSGQQPDRLHPLRLPRPFFVPPLLGHIFEDTHDLKWGAVVAAGQDHTVPDPPIGTVRPTQSVVHQVASPLEGRTHIVEGTPIIRMDVAFPEALVFYEGGGWVAKSFRSVRTHIGQVVGMLGIRRVHHRRAQVHQVGT